MMGLKSNFVTFVSILLLLVYTTMGQTILDITKNGAKPNSDVTEIMKNTWKEACASMKPTTILIPKGEYQLSEISMEGPCKKPIEIKLKGTLRAPAEPSGEAMIAVRYVDQLTFSGPGVIDGQGKLGWAKNDCHKNDKCKKLPMNLRLNFVTNSLVEGITSLNSKNFQINLLGCKNLTFHHVSVIAPDESPNTDGIHISNSEEIHVLDSKIATGDDCISLGDKLRQIHITNVTCGPGHGISLGSLGQYAKEKDIEGIYVKKCKFTGTDNGVRIKTWPNSPVPLKASEIHFEDIEMVDVKNPIVIDQEYCPYNKCDKKVPSKVKLNNISFKNIRGTSATPIAVEIICSKSKPCENVEFVDINLTGSKGKSVKSQCLNVKPLVSGKQNPKICAEVAPSIMSSR